MRLIHNGVGATIFHESALNTPVAIAQAYTLQLLNWKIQTDCIVSSLSSDFY